jgi:hypothetical protein
MRILYHTPVYTNKIYCFKCIISKASFNETVHILNLVPSAITEREKEPHFATMQ